MTTVGGVCESLALKWLKVKSKEKDSGKLKPAERVGIVDRDKTVEKAFARYAASESDQKIGLESYYGLKGTWQVMPTGNTPVGITSFVARKVADSTHEYFLHSIKCPKYNNGNHAIAYYTSGGKGGLFKHVYVFDPDFGEYKVPPSKFVPWMPEFVKEFYGAGEGDSRWLKQVSLGAKTPTP